MCLCDKLIDRLAAFQPEVIKIAWFDDGLGRMQGVDIEDVADVLK